MVGGTVIKGSIQTTLHKICGRFLLKTYQKCRHSRAHCVVVIGRKLGVKLKYGFGFFRQITDLLYFSHHY